jgi:hypothetical protein
MEAMNEEKAGKVSKEKPQKRQVAPIKLFEDGRANLAAPFFFL